jgi:hypothetical protein
MGSGTDPDSGTRPNLTFGRPVNDPRSPEPPYGWDNPAPGTRLWRYRNLPETLTDLDWRLLVTDFDQRASSSDELPPHTRLILASENLLDEWGTRTERGERITVEWGEQQPGGWYEPVFTVHSDDTLASSSDELRAAAQFAYEQLRHHWSDAEDFETIIEQDYGEGPRAIGHTYLGRAASRLRAALSSKSSAEPARPYDYETEGLSGT